MRRPPQTELTPFQPQIPYAAAKLTAVAIVSREKALEGIQNILRQLQADDLVKKAAARRDQLKLFPPPGATEIVISRQATVTS